MKRKDINMIVLKVIKNHGLYVLDEEEIVSCDKLVDILKQYKNKKIVFTNGCTT